jgi:hypothetical protein
MSNLFSKVKNSLKSLYDHEVQGHAQQHMTTLTSLITGMINTGRSNLGSISTGLAQDIDAASREKHAKRFLEHKNTTYDVHYLPFVEVILKQIILESNHKVGIKFVIDGSMVNSAHIALMISVVKGNQAIPVYWVVKKGKKGHFTTQMHLDVVQKVVEIIQNILEQLALTHIPVTLLGDGEFDSVELQALCRSPLKWDYIFRTACDTLLYEEDDEFQPKHLGLAPNTSFLFISGVDFSKKRFQDVNFLYWHDVKIYKDPLFLVSSFDDPMQIMDDYKIRFSIERLFKNFKSAGFNLHKNRLRIIHAIQNLIIVAALAFCIVLNFGLKNKASPLRKKVQRIDKNSLSIFSFAYQFIRYCMRMDIHFVLNFDFKDT